MIRVENSKTMKDVVVRKVAVRGLTDLMFDRYPGDNRTQLEPWQRLYIIPGGRTICIPATNLVSAMTAENTNSFPRVLLDSRKYKTFARAILSYTSISPQYIPILRNGQPLELGSALDADIDPETGVYIHRTVARLKDGIPNPKARPTIPCPWSIEFEWTIFPNTAFQEQELRNIFAQGGIALGLGTFRGVFGKFEITRWE